MINNLFVRAIIPVNALHACIIQYLPVRVIINKHVSVRPTQSVAVTVTDDVPVLKVAEVCACGGKLVAPVDR